MLNYLDFIDVSFFYLLAALALQHVINEIINIVKATPKQLNEIKDVICVFPRVLFLNPPF